MRKPPISEADFRRRLADSAPELTDEEAQNLARFLALLSKWNRVYNLTGTRDADTLVERHLVESLALRGRLQGRAIADVGTGAGLPGIPLAIVEPGRSFTLIESRAKRVRFLRHVVGALGLSNVSIEHSRAEDLSSGPVFDTLLARAVAPPAELLALARRLTHSGSKLLILTSAERSEVYRDLAPDFVLEGIEPSAVGERHSAIVQLERIDA